MASSTFQVHRHLEEKSASVIILQSDVKHALDNYADLKKKSWRLTSGNIRHLSQYSSEKAVPLTCSQLHGLAAHLSSIRENQYNSNKTYVACATLFTKMGGLVDYAAYDLKIFTMMAHRPELDAYVKSIKKKAHPKKVDIGPFIRHYPDALKFIAKDFTMTALDLSYCSKMHDFRFYTRACKAVDALKLHDQLLYHNIQREVIPHVLLPNPYDCYRQDYALFEVTGYTYKDHNKSLNREYMAKLNSNENIDFIFANSENSSFISYVLIGLHYGRLGENEQKQAEKNIRRNPLFLHQLANAFEHLTDADLINKENLNLILLICDPINRECSEQMALAAVEFAADGKLSKGKLDIIKQNPTNAYAISQTYGLLAKSGLTDLINTVYLNAGIISQAVPEILRQLDSAKPSLLSRENAQKVIENLAHADTLLQKMPWPLTQEGFTEVVQNNIRVEPSLAPSSPSTKRA